MKILEGWDIPILKMTYLLGMLKVQTHFCKYKGAKIKVKQYGTPDFKTLRLSNIHTFWNLIRHFNYLISWLPDIVQICFCTPDGAMDPTFKINMFVAKEIKQKLWHIFLWTPCSCLFFVLAWHPPDPNLHCIAYLHWHQPRNSIQDCCWQNHRNDWQPEYFSRAMVWDEWG